MWEASYGKEPFDLRLTVLRMVSCWRLIIVCTLAGTLALGGLYCVKNLLLRGEPQYRAESTYRVDYAVEDAEVSSAAINAYTWNTYVHTGEFLDSVRSRLEDSELARLGNDELGEVIQGNLESDWRVPSTVVTTESPEKSVAIARAVEAAMTLDFPGGISEIETIRVIDAAEEAREVVPDVRVARAFVLAAVLSFFFTLVILLLKETGDDSIWLPATVSRRYGLKVLGTIESRELKQNIRYLFREKERAAVCTVRDTVNPAEIAEMLNRMQEAGEALDTRSVGQDENGRNVTFYALPSPLLCPEAVEALREAEGILLAVEAGTHAGKQLEYVLEYLTQQDLNITAVILWNADEKLLKRYYRFTPEKK